MNDYLRLIGGLIWLLLPPLLQGQHRQLGLPPINNYSKQDYQAETQNWAATEDSRGLLYFGNNQGLLEFDGTNWQCYTLPNRSIVRSIAVDSLGRILVGCQDELGYFEADDRGTLQYFSLVERVPTEFRNFEDVWEIHLTQGGIFWRTQNYIFRQQGESFEVIETENRFDDLYHARSELYLAEWGAGLKQWDGRQFQPLERGDYFADWEITQILPHEDGGLLVATREQGMFHYKAGSIRAWVPEIQAFLRENRIFCALRLENGQYAIGTSHQGLLILDANGTPLRNLSRANGLLNNSILSLHEDRSHNLWIGLENGISYVELSSPFSWINPVVGVEGSAYASVVFDDKLYLGTNQGVFFQDWTYPPTPLSPGRFELVGSTKGPSWSLNVIGGSLIAGLHTGAARIEGNQARQISPVNGSWKLIQLEKSPRYAIEGSYAGLSVYEQKPGQRNWTFKSRLEGFEESSRVMEQDASGNIWISHPYRGVFRVRIDPEAALIRSMDMFTKADGLPSNLSINVARIQGHLLFTTEKGVYEFDETTQRFVPHEGFNRLFGEETKIHRLIEDENGTIWFSTEEEFGILKIEDQTVEKQISKLPFNRLQNRLVKGFEHIYAYDKEHVFIGTDEGFMLYNPQKNQDRSNRLPLYIRSVSVRNGQDSLVFGGTFRDSNGRILLAQAKNQVLSFAPDIHDFHITYSAAFYEDINEVQYQYLLQGQDQLWSDWTNKTEKEYTNLTPGEYVFQVRARNIYGLESEPATYTFSILPPWHQTTLARLIFVGLALGGIFGIFWFNAIQLRHRTEEMRINQAQTLEKKEAEFLEEVQKSEAEIIRLRNEKLQAEVMHKNKELASSTMHLVQKGEILVKIKQNLEKVSTESNPTLKKQIRQIVRTIDDDIRLDKNWKQFEHHFDQVHEQFLQHLREKYPVLTPKDQRLCAYLRMNLATKEIAQLMNISVRGVEISRYRLRKKLDLDREVNLNEFMTSL